MSDQLEKGTPKRSTSRDGSGFRNPLPDLQDYVRQYTQPQDDKPSRENDPRSTVRLVLPKKNLAEPDLTEDKGGEGHCGEERRGEDDCKKDYSGKESLTQDAAPVRSQEPTAAEEQALAALNKERVQAQQEGSQAKEQALGALQSGTELGPLSAVSESWYAMQADLLRLELEASQQDAHTVYTNAEFSIRERSEWFDGLLARLDRIKQRLDPVQAHAAERASEAQTAVLEGQTAGVLAELRQAVERQDAALVELSAQVSDLSAGSELATAPDLSALVQQEVARACAPIGKRGRWMWLLFVLALALITAVGAAGVLLPR